MYATRYTYSFEKILLHSVEVRRRDIGCCIGTLGFCCESWEIFFDSLIDVLWLYGQWPPPAQSNRLHTALCCCVVFCSIVSGLDSGVSHTKAKILHVQKRALLAFWAPSASQKAQKVKRALFWTCNIFAFVCATQSCHHEELDCTAGCHVCH